MAKTTLYVPDDFRTELKELKEKLQAPLSKWFVNKAREELETIRNASKEAEMEDDEMEAVIERLRKSGQSEQNAARNTGIDMGMIWAKQHADHSELKSMAEDEVMEEEGLWDPSEFDPEPGFWWNVFRYRYQSTEYIDNFNFDRETYELLNDKALNRAFCEGFVQGAQKVWVQVKDKI